MDQEIANWRSPNLRDTTVGVGSIVTVSTYSTARDVTHYLEVLEEPFPITTMVCHVDHAQAVTGVWRPFQLAFGQLRYDHSKPFTHGGPVWLDYPFSNRPEAVRPAAVAWRIDDQQRYVVAGLWIGEPGQRANEFRRRVLATIPQPVPLDQRFAMRQSLPVRVLVAAEPSDERAALVELLIADKRIIVLTADSAEEVDAKLAGAHVMIVADKLPSVAGGKPQSTFSLGIIEERRWDWKPLVGWPVDSCRRYIAGDLRAGPTGTAEQMRANCGHLLNWLPYEMDQLNTLMNGLLYEPGRSVEDLILDALGVRCTTTESPIP